MPRTGRNTVPPGFQPISEDDEFDDMEGLVSAIDFHLLPSGNFGSSTQHLYFSTEGPISDCVDSLEAAESSSAKLAPIPTQEALYDEDPLGEMILIDPTNDAKMSSDVPKERSAYNPIRSWMPKREVFLQEFIRMEGRGDFIDLPCPSCGSPEALYRCTECTSGELFCSGCIVKKHAYNPLHIIEMWDQAMFFKKVSLKSLGLKVQLGHPPSETCRNPALAHAGGFIVLDIYGIHQVEVYLCKCEKSLEPYLQILRHGWYPASINQPKTAATLNVLKFFQLLNFESKASQYDFYNTLARWSDNTGVNPPKDRYSAFGTMIREFRHLKALKRGARAHKEGGAEGTRPGELAVLCPACPQPGLNMSDEWENASDEERFLYCLFLAIDANFRLKRRDVSSESKDPSLGDGWAYFVPLQEYTDHLAEFDSKIIQPKSTCSEHKAVTAERAGKGLASTGICAVDCARHDMKRPLAVGDLQKGERYVNTDFMFFRSIQDSECLEYVVSYDICCQWSINLWERMEKYPRWTHFDHTGKRFFRFLVPKFHLPAHIESCQIQYSFNLTPFVGRTDGEAPERGWARFNSISTSSSEMSPGNRRDTIDDHFSDSNWKKTTGMARAFVGKSEEAESEAEELTFLHNEFASGLPAKTVRKWEKELSTWERCKSAQNPFEKRNKRNLDSVRKKLAAEDAEQMKNGKGFVMHDRVSASQLVTIGLDLEQQQRQISVRYGKRNQSAGVEARLQNRMNVLERKIMSWIQIQHLYIPRLYDFRDKAAAARSDKGTELLVHSIKLHLPSEILRSNRQIDCDRRLVLLEYELRQAQAGEALDELRNALRLRSFVLKDKNRFQRGQRANTRSRGILSRLEGNVSEAAEKYRAARRAIASLAPFLGKPWEEKYPTLLKEDLRSWNDDVPPSHMEEQTKKKTKKKRRASTKVGGKVITAKPPAKLSWIWQRLGVHPGKQKGKAWQEDLRIEFCKSKSRARGWKEEVRLLREEMGRVKRFFQTRRTQWEELAKSDLKGNEHQDPAIAEGRKAYALEQAHVYREMFANCNDKWGSIPH